MEKTIAMWKRYFAIVYLMNWEEDDMDTDILLYLIQARNVAMQSRYLNRSATNRMKPRRWEFLLKNTMMVNDTEFLHEFRISRQCFYSLLHLLQTHNPESADCKVVECVHVLTLLKFLGSFGTFTSIGSPLGIGYGSVAHCIERAMTAVLSLKKEVIVWPNEEERKLISQGFSSAYSFANCIGIVDGTIFPLEFKPTLNGEDYFHRKGGYGVHSLLFCDNNTRIRYMTMGNATSVHDNRIWRMSKICLNPEQYFSNNQYLIGDSAFCPSNYISPTFKKPFNADMDEYKTFFNMMLAKPRIRSEHCIGLLKGRFPYLKRIQVIISNKNSLIRINRLVTTSAILHNMLLDEEYPVEWIEEENEDEDSSSDETSEELHTTIPDNGRRTRIFQVLCELHL
jgi:DDE superfamily endonuclease